MVSSRRNKGGLSSKNKTRRRSGGGITRMFKKDLAQFTADPLGVVRTGRAMDLITIETVLTEQQWRILKQNFLYLATTPIYGRGSEEFTKLYQLALAKGAFKKE